MRLLTQEDGDISSFSDKIAESEAAISNSSLKHMLIDSHTNDDNRGEIRADLPFEHVFGFAEMTKTLIKSRYKPKYEIKSQTQTSKDINSINLPQNLQNFKQKLLSGSAFIVYR